jgi:sugar lactone lactonase YvrE
MDTNNILYVADLGNNRIMQYAPGSFNGTIVAGNGSAGSALNQLSGPPAVVVDNNGYVTLCLTFELLFILNILYLYDRYIYVADSDNARIMRWTTNYTAGGVCIIACSGVAGNAANQLGSARDIKFDRFGNIYVTDQANHRIQKYMIQLTTAGCPSSKYRHFLIKLLYFERTSVDKKCG